MATWRRRGGGSSTYRNADYQPLPAQETDDALLDNQFITPPVKVPWYGLTFALILSIGGASLLFTAFLIAIGYIDSNGDGIWPLTVIGLIMVIPGGYHLFVAYMAFIKRPGYSFEDIPNFD